MNTLIKAFVSPVVMWTATIVSSTLGIAMLATASRWGLPVTIRGLQHWSVFAITVIAAVCLAAAPCIRFLQSGWMERLQEFRNRIRQGGSTQAYLEQFWEGRLREILVSTEDPRYPDELEKLLNNVCRFGRRPFGSAVILFLATIFIVSALTIQTGIDACVAARCLGATPGISGHFAPFGDILLPAGSAAALAGAYLFSVGDAIRAARQRNMNVSDVCWYSLRLVVTIPLGLAVSQVSAPNVGILVSFGLGAFPMDALLKLTRRLTSKSLGGSEEQQEQDQLVQLDGVTARISATLSAEGVDSIDELVGVDPVLLSTRSGVPFSSILRFASQAVVRLHIGPRADQLVPLGLGSAYLISEFVHELRNDAPGSQERLQDAVVVLKKEPGSQSPSSWTVRAAFCAIADNGYTRFLKAMG